jgi:glycosyltransferase involved in cell wall biosynthesis
VPNYNHAIFLKERLDSIFHQSFQDFEIILLDDCSTDNSIDVLTQYSKSKKVSHFLANSENSGSPIHQWYKGIALAKYDWIWIAESDDIADRFFLEKLIKKIERDVALIYCRSTIIDCSSQKVSGSYFWADDLDIKKWHQDYIEIGINEICSSLRYRNTIPNASACLFNKTYLPELKLINEFKFAGDWMFWVLLIKNAQIAFLSSELNKFRSHKASTRNQKSRKQELLRIEEYFKVINFTNRLCCLHQSKQLYKNYYWIFSELKSKKKLLGFSYFLPPIPVKYLIPYYKFLFAGK